MADGRERRFEALCERLTVEQLDGLIVTSAPNIRYLTGFSGSSAILLVSQHERVLISDYRYASQARDEAGTVARIVIEDVSLWNGVWQQLPGIPGQHVVGFESAHLTHRDFQRLLESGARWQWRPTTGLVEALREKKDADELSCIQEAIDCAEAALERTVASISAGMSELEVTAILESELRRAGSDGFAFSTIVASGPNSARPHAKPGDRPLRTGDLLLIDFGSRVRGYCSDITRTFAIGAPTAKQQEVHDIVREANARACRSVRAGQSGRDADRLARGYIEDRGFGESFGHSLGHGVGLEVHEAPRLARTADGILIEGAVVTVEPGIYLPEWGGVRIEDDVHLGADGARVLTRFPRELIGIG